MTIRPLTTIEDCRRVAALEREIWGYADAEDVVPPPVLIVSVKRGGILLGAFGHGHGHGIHGIQGIEGIQGIQGIHGAEGRGRHGIHGGEGHGIDGTGTADGTDGLDSVDSYTDAALLGFVYSIPGIKAGRLTQWSHMLGVVPAARAAGVGVALKLAQRQRALAMGIDLIEWTFDPLQAANAHLNFCRLGTVAEEYAENVYGESSSVLHHGTPTDRLIAAWNLTAPHVQRRLAPGGLGLIRAASVASAPVVNPLVAGDPWPRPGRADLALDPPRVLVEIPAGFSELQQSDRSLALEWRLHVRGIFQAYFGRGYRAVDFFLSREAGLGQYLLAAAAAA